MVQINVVIEYYPSGLLVNRKTDFWRTGIPKIPPALIIHVSLAIGHPLTGFDQTVLYSRRLYIPDKIGGNLP